MSEANLNDNLPGLDVTQPSIAALLARDNANIQRIIDRHNSDVANYYSVELKSLMSVSNGNIGFDEAQKQVMRQLTENIQSHLWAAQTGPDGRYSVIDGGVYQPPAPATTAAPPMSPVGNADPFVPNLFYANHAQTAGMLNGTKWTLDPRGTFQLSAILAFGGNMQYWWTQIP